MKPELLEMYIDVTETLANLDNPSLEELKHALDLYFNVEVSIEELYHFYLPEVQDRLAHMKAWGINY